MNINRTRFQIVAWTCKRDVFGNARHTFGRVLYDSAWDNPWQSAGAVAEANRLCGKHGPVAIGRLEGDAFRPAALLNRPLGSPVSELKGLSTFPLTKEDIPT